MEALNRHNVLFLSQSDLEDSSEDEETERGSMRLPDDDDVSVFSDTSSNADRTPSMRLPDDDEISVYSTTGWDSQDEGSEGSEDDDHEEPYIESIIEGCKVGDEVNLLSISYASLVDEHLLCPICKSVLIDPVTTRCGHVFCKECFTVAYNISPSCPIDRIPVSRNFKFIETSRTILNLLDSLEIHCPNFEEGCNLVMERAIAQDHIDKYCDYTLVECKEKGCERLIARKDYNKGCLHWNVSCPHCNNDVLFLDLELHKKKHCKALKTNCEGCGRVLDSRLKEVHKEVCLEITGACKWAKYGCDFEANRGDLPAHYMTCKVGKLGSVIDSLQTSMFLVKSMNQQQAKEIDDLKAELKKYQDLETFCESDTESSATSTEAVEDPYESRDNYILAQLAAQDEKIRQMFAFTNQSDTRTHNELMLLAQQLAEMRNTIGPLQCHVRWMMVKMRGAKPTMGGMGGGAGMTSPGGSSDNGDGERRLPRRLSDTGGNATKL